MDLHVLQTMKRSELTLLLFYKHVLKLLQLGQLLGRTYL